MMQLGVPGERDLEAAVEEEPVDVIGAHAPADAVGGFEHRALDAAEVQRPGARQPGEPGTDDADLDLPGHRGLRRRRRSGGSGFVDGFRSRATREELYEPDED